MSHNWRFGLIRPRSTKYGAYLILAYFQSVRKLTNHIRWYTKEDWKWRYNLEYLIE